MISWTLEEFIETLCVAPDVASRSIPILEMQGYIKATGNHEWITTMSGENISESSMPYFDTKSVQRAIEELRDRIRRLNKDKKSVVTVIDAVAFGDFLRDGPRSQAADVGIALRRRSGDSKVSANDARAVFMTLRAKSPFLHLRRYEPWMGARTHQKFA